VKGSKPMDYKTFHSLLFSTQFRPHFIRNGSRSFNVYIFHRMFIDHPQNVYSAYSKNSQ